MSQYTAVITWERNGAVFTDNRYSRGHRWNFDGGIEVPAPASPQVVPLPLSVAAATGCLNHLRRYLEMLFNQPKRKETS